MHNIDYLTSYLIFGLTLFTLAISISILLTNLIIRKKLFQNSDYKMIRTAIISLTLAVFIILSLIVFVYRLNNQEASAFQMIKDVASGNFRINVFHKLRLLSSHISNAKVIKHKIKEIPPDSYTWTPELSNLNQSLSKLNTVNSKKLYYIDPIRAGICKNWIHTLRKDGHTVRALDRSKISTLLRDSATVNSSGLLVCADQISDDENFTPIFNYLTQGGKVLMVGPLPLHESTKKLGLNVYNDTNLAKGNYSLSFTGKFFSDGYISPGLTIGFGDHFSQWPGVFCENEEGPTSFVVLKALGEKAFSKSFTPMIYKQIESGLLAWTSLPPDMSFLNKILYGDVLKKVRNHISSYLFKWPIFRLTWKAKFSDSKIPAAIVVSNIYSNKVLKKMKKMLKFLGTSVIYDARGLKLSDETDLLKEGDLLLNNWQSAYGKVNELKLFNFPGPDLDIPALWLMSESTTPRLFAFSGSHGNWMSPVKTILQLSSQVKENYKNEIWKIPYGPQNSERLPSLWRMGLTVPELTVSNLDQATDILKLINELQGFAVIRLNAGLYIDSHQNRLVLHNWFFANRTKLDFKNLSKWVDDFEKLGQVEVNKTNRAGGVVDLIFKRIKKSNIPYQLVSTLPFKLIGCKSRLSSTRKWEEINCIKSEKEDQNKVEFLVESVVDQVSIRLEVHE